MEGRKQVEFRKRPFADRVAVVWVYATAPIQRIIGYFEVDRMHIADPADLWREFADVGCIDREDFDRYYAGRSTGAGITIRKAVRLEVPARVVDLLPSGIPPQSFAYVGQVDSLMEPAGQPASLAAKDSAPSSSGARTSTSA